MPLVATRRGQAADHLLDHGGIETAGRQVVEEKERPGALDQDVVDAVVHQVLANRVVGGAEKGNLELGAHPIGRGHKDRLPQAAVRHVEKAPEGAQI